MLKESLRLKDMKFVHKIVLRVVLNVRGFNNHGFHILAVVFLLHIKSHLLWLMTKLGFLCNRLALLTCYLPDIDLAV